jgi:8-oxo-dGTP pyrophosphatase MutT (NUDIX family)
LGLSPYLAALREKVGHDLVLAPSVAVLARDERGRVLMMLNRDTGLWQTIGGMIEPDESPQDAARREAAEEAGVTVELRGILAVTGGPQFRLTYPNGDQVAYVPTIFDAVVTAGEPRPDGRESTAVEWFTPAELARAETDEFTRALLAAAIPPGGIEPPLRA